MDTYLGVRKLAKSIKYQNLFFLAKDFKNIQIFNNTGDLSQLQDMFFSYLYMYDALNQDIAIKKVTKKVLDSEIYEDAYLLWKKEKGNNTIESENEKHDVVLVHTDTINFPKKEVI